MKMMFAISVVMMILEFGRVATGNIDVIGIPYYSVPLPVFFVAYAMLAGWGFVWMVREKQA